MSRASEPLAVGPEADGTCVSVATLGCAASEGVDELEDDEDVSGPASGSDLEPLPSTGGTEWSSLMASGSNGLKSNTMFGSCCGGG